MSELEDSLTLLRDKMEKDISIAQPYEAMLYCQSFLARKKRSLSVAEAASCLVAGAKTLLNRGEISYATTLVVWFIESKMLHIDEVEKVFTLLTEVPSSQAINFLGQLYSPLSKFMNSHLSSEGNQTLMKLNAFSAPVFEAAGHHREAIKCFHLVNDMEGVARVLHAMALRGHSSEYPLFFTRTYLYLLSGTAHFAVLSDAFFVAVECEYMAPYRVAHPEAEASRCWEMCDMIHDLHELPDQKNTGVKIDKAGLFEVLLGHFSPLLKHLDGHLLSLLEVTGLRVFGVRPRQQAAQSNPLHSIMSNMFSSK